MSSTKRSSRKKPARAAKSRGSATARTRAASARGGAGGSSGGSRNGAPVLERRERGGASSSAGRPGARKNGVATARKKHFTAKTADKYELYQFAVQSPKEDVAFLARVYPTYRGKTAQHFREDFCGTGLLTATWIARGKDYTAEGFDIDPEPVSWGMEHNFEPLGEAASRAVLHLKDVREPSRRPPDVRCAQNFSYFVFQERAELVDYFRKAYDDLAADGIFVLDIYGGPESMEEMEEVRRIDEGFTYVWDQHAYYPASGDYKSHIHFRFKDGTELKRAFSYEWRLWTLLEVRDALLEAGFPLVETYWEGTDEDGESGNGIYRKSAKGDNCLSWVTYLVAVK
jgi:hypothetical protein